MNARILIVSCATVFVAACGSTPAPPEWQSNAYTALERFKLHYLEGNTRLAERYFAEAKSAIAATGKPDLAARTELVRCAIGTSALDFDACAGFEAVQGDAAAEDRAYADFLAGHWQKLDAGKLPSQYQAVVRAGDDAARTRTMQQIEDPVSRLIAAGALLKSGRLSPPGVATAVETASAQGYRRPLLAYLKVQEKLAETAGDAASLQTIRKRIKLAEGQQ